MKNKRGASKVLEIILLILIAMVFVLIIWRLFKLFSMDQEELAQAKAEIINFDADIINTDISENGIVNITISRNAGKIFLKNQSTVKVPSKIDIMLVSDVSGSMEFCDASNQVSFDKSFWTKDSETYCSSRYYKVQDCNPNKLSKMIEAEKAFISQILSQSNSSVGIVEYSSRSPVNRSDKPDLSVSMYIGSDKDVCYTPNWLENTFDDSQWKDYLPTLSVPVASPTQVVFRKHFSVVDISKIKSLKLSVAHSAQGVCFINEKEAYQIPYRTNLTAIKWINTVQIPPNVLNNGDNILACAVRSGSSSSGSQSWGFDAKLETNLGNLIPENSEWKYLNKSGCNPDFYASDPKAVDVPNATLNNFNIYASILNKGKKPTSPFNITFYNNTGKIQEIEIQGINQWEIVTTKFNWQSFIQYKPTPGNDIIAVVDSSNAINEQNETNNNYKIEIGVYSPGKDLSISSLSYSPVICSWNPTTYSLNVTFTNKGTEDITENFWVAFFKDSNKIGEVLFTGGVKKQQSNTTGILWSASLTSPTNISAVVDYHNNVTEIDETNNQKKINISLSKPNLYFYVTNPFYSSNFIFPQAAQPFCSSPLNFTLTISNNNCDAGASKMNISISNGFSDSIDVPEIQAGKKFQKDYSVPYYSGPGKITFTAKADINGNVVEEKENDNTNSVTYDFGPDLYFTRNIIITPSTVQKNEQKTFSINASVSNKQCSAGAFNVNFYYDSTAPGNLISTNRVLLTGTETKEILVSWTASLASDTSVYAQIDPLNEVAEYNETNNITNSKIIVRDIPAGTGSVVGFSILPGLKFNFFDILGIVDKCEPVTDTSLFDDSIARTIGLTSNYADLENFASKAETWWDTCLCCGIKKATNMLQSSSSSVKVMIVMSDGSATDKCSSSPSKTPSEDAIDAATNAADEKIKVYTVGFGSVSDEDTLRSIADKGNGKCYTSNMSGIVDLYRQMAEDIKYEFSEEAAFDYLIVMLYNATNSCEKKITEPPLPYETKRYTLNTKDCITDITRIEIYFAATTKSGRKVIGPLLDTWNVKKS